jgi:DNA-binding transcriptional MerR regulator
MTMAANINNLNILTFIKDIYLSLKHIDTCFNSYRETIDTRLIRIEDNQQIILDKLNILEQTLNKINSNTEQQVSLDKNIENELLEKMQALNNNTTHEKLTLKPDELTIANIIENNYDILDINKTLATPIQYNIMPDPVTLSDVNIDASIDASMRINVNKKSETLDNLLF